MTKLVLALFPALLFAQAAPSFDVASIKPSDALKKAGATSGWSISPSGNGLKIVGSLQTLIRYAYGMEDVQIYGGPAWLDRDIFEINAKAATQVSGDDLKLMLRSLLAERFQLTSHTETRQLPIYSLVTLKGASKLPEGDTNMKGSFSTGPGSLRGTMDTPRFAAHLTSMLGRTVIDNTGLNGIWKFDLTWAPEDGTPTAAIFSAIQEQVGLKLEATKGPVQVLVIDRAEKPSEN